VNGVSLFFLQTFYNFPEKYMLVLRQIYLIQNNQLLIQLPSSFDGYQEVEVIVLPVESSQKRRLSTPEFLHRFAGVIPHFPEIESPGVLQEREELP
jgi:hypothetical protein